MFNLERRIAVVRLQCVFFVKLLKNKGMKEQEKVAWRITLVAALGYFVDVFDLLLFNVVKTESLTDLGASGQMLFDLELSIQNWQLAGMLLGGLVWGILGDKYGRLKILFGSILTYSLASMANAFVTDFETYKVLRFIAGIGLAGELGGGVTLVAETMPKDKRGLGTMIIAATGVLGAPVAALVGGQMGWQTAYLVGGIMGLALLFLRAGTLESEMFERTLYNDAIKKGSLKMLFLHPSRAAILTRCILIGMPIWFVGGILVPQSHRFSVELGAAAPILVRDSIIYTYLGLAVGDLLSGALSQYLQSRRRALLIFLGAQVPMLTVFFFLSGYTPFLYHTFNFALGILSGYWAVLISSSAEQFGTNIRATVSNVVPNFVRGLTVPMVWGFQALLPVWNGRLLPAAMVVGYSVLALALFAASGLAETFSKDLNYIEE